VQALNFFNTNTITLSQNMVGWTAVAGSPPPPPHYKMLPLNKISATNPTVPGHLKPFISKTIKVK
jgi:hypothetical protein